MPYVPLTIPAGLFKAGTDYQARGRWLAGDRIRWYKGLLRPIGGWYTSKKSDGTAVDVVLPTPADQVCRAMLAWRDADADAKLAIGHNEGLGVLDASGAFTDITPVGWVDKDTGPTTNIGYGGGFYGRNAYGTERPVAESAARVFNWCLRTWGNQLVAGPRWPTDSALYVWTGTGVAAVPTPTSGTVPTNFNCFNVTPQQSIMTGGASGNPRLLQWCDLADYTAWAAAATNQAGDYQLPGTGRIMEITTVLGQQLIVTETDAHIASYLGPPYVYGFKKVGDYCGTLNGAAVVTTDRFAVWPGRRAFYIFDGTLRRIESTLDTDVLRDVNGASGGKTVGFTIADYSEVWWLYQSVGADDIDKYVAWNWAGDYWFTGTISRTCATDRGAFDNVLMVDSDGVLYDHEQIGVIPGATASEVYAETGPLELGEGDQQAIIRSIVPDFEVSGSLNVTFYCQDRPTQTERAVGPYAITYPATTSQPIPTRARGRTIRMRIEGDDENWSLGRLRLEMAAVGRR